MKKNTFTLRGALTCAALSIALVAGLVPAQALSTVAFAAEGGEDAPAAAEVQPEAEATDRAEQASSASGQAAEADRVNEVVPVAAQQGSDAAAADAAASEQPADVAATPSDAEIDMLTTSVSLSGSGTVLTSNGLTYQVNEDGQSVAVIGWATPAPEGALSIPEQIVVGTVAYRVTAAKAAEGVVASDAAADPAGDVDSYATDFYAEADKAPGVTSIAIPASVEAIDPAFFQQFPNAATVAVAGDNPHFDSHNGMLFTEGLTDLLLVPEGMEGAAVLPASVVTVPACVITRCTKLQAMDIPTGSTVEARFASENGILYTADKATLLAAPAGIGASVRIAPECTAIAAGAFWGNEGLKTIIAPGQIASIAAADDETAAAAFNDETIATAMVLTADRAVWEAAGFASFADPAEPGQTIAPSEQAGMAYLLQDDGTLAAYWEGEGDAPEALTIPATVELDGIAYRVATIADDGFADQASLTAIELPEGLTAIGERAFAGCGLASVSIPGSVTSIGASAFAGCAGLAEVSLGEGTRSIGASAFAGTAIEQIALPASVASIGQDAFAACENLTCVLALGDVQEVDATALAEDSGVSVYVPLREDGAYAWSLGAPAANNHLMPYGVQGSAEPIALAEGESADLFEDGYLEAPGEVQVTSSYKSNVSVTDDCTVTAKQLGTTPVTTTLSLGDTQLASTTQTARVSLASQASSSESGIMPLWGDDEDQFNMTWNCANGGVIERNYGSTTYETSEMYGATISAPDISWDYEITGNVEFVEWNSEWDGSGETLTSDTCAYGDMTWYAIWREKTGSKRAAYQVRTMSLTLVNTAGASVLTDLVYFNNVSEGTCFVGSDNSFEARFDYDYAYTSGEELDIDRYPIKDGYQFDGWQSKTDGWVQSDMSDLQDYYDYDHNNSANRRMTLTGRVSDLDDMNYRDWFQDGTDPFIWYRTGFTPDAEHSSYAVTFHDNGGSGGPGSMQLQYGESHDPLSTKIPKKNGYIFAGYYDGISSNANLIFGFHSDCPSSGSPHIYGAWKKTSNGTVYAHWNPIYYTVTWKSQDGSVTYETDRNVIYGSQPQYNGASPTKDSTPQYDFEFMDWATSPNQTSGTEDIDLPSVTGNVIYYAAFGQNLRSYYVSGTGLPDGAVWIPYGTKITIYRSGSGTVGAPVTINGENIDLDKQWTPAIKEGHTFTGWSYNASNHSFTAQYEPIKYTVKFDTQGGSSIAQTTIAYGSGITKPADPTKSGYSFAGWYKEAACTNAWNFNTDVVKGTTTLYAKWIGEERTYYVEHWYQKADKSGYDQEEKTFTGRVGETVTATKNEDRRGFQTGRNTTIWLASGVIPADANSPLCLGFIYDRESYGIVFVANGGTINGALPSEYTFGNTVTLPTDVTREGYAFAGWYDNSQLSGNAIASIGDNETGAKTFYAKWNRSTANYKVEHKLQQYGTTQYVTADTNTFSANVGDTVTANTRVFEGFHENTTHPSRVVSGTVTADGSLTLVRYYDYDVYTVSFDTDGGSSISSQQVAYDRTVTKPSDPTKTGYDFAGWYSDAAKTTPFDFTTKIKGNTTIYAKWTIKTFTYTWKSQDGTKTLHVDEGIPYGGSIAYDGPAPTKAADERYTYEFNGWTIAENMESGNNKNGEAFTEVRWDETLFATFLPSPRSYSIAFETNGGTINGNKPTGYTYGDTVTLPTDVTRTDYTFAGWYDNAQLSGNAVTSIASDAYGDKKFFAKWELAGELHTITWDTRTGGSVAEPTSRFVEGHALTESDIPVPDGPAWKTKMDVQFVFDGWYEDVRCTSDKLSAGATVDADKTYYAGWRTADGDRVFDVSLQNITTNVGEPYYDLPLESIKYYDLGDEMGFDSVEAYLLPSNEDFNNALYELYFNFYKAESYSGSDEYFFNAPELTGWEFSYWQVDGGGEFYFWEHPEWLEAPANYPEESYSQYVWFYESALIAGSIDELINRSIDSVCFEMHPEMNPTASYKATYHAEGATNVPRAQTTYEWLKVTKPTTNPVKDGCTFIEWRVGSEDGPAYDFNERVHGNIDLYAAWQVNDHTITWNANGGAFAGGATTATTTVEHGQPTTTAGVPELPDYTDSQGRSWRFVGWNASSSATAAGTFPASTEGDATYYAVWVERFTVTFMANGEVYDTATVDKGQPVAKPADPTRAGYRFDSWRNDSERGTLWNFNSAVNANTTLYASWIANDATVTVTHYWQNLDGSYTKESSETETIEGKKVGETVSAPTKSQDGFRRDESLGTIRGTVPTSGTLELTIYYERLSYTLRYTYVNGLNPGLGVGGFPKDVTKKYGETVVVEYPSEVAGWQFNGWKVESGGITLDESGVFQMPASEVKLVAQWEKLPAYIEFYIDGVLQSDWTMAGLTGESTGGGLCPVPDAREGYTFKGWYDNPEYTGNRVTKVISNFPVGTTKYYGKWEPNAYQVRWWAEGGTFESTTSSFMYTDTVYGEPIPADSIPRFSATPVGKKLAGWGVSRGSTEPVDLTQPVRGDLDYYAIWVADAVDYTIECYERSADGSETLIEGRTLAGIVGQTVTVSAPVITGFTVEQPDSQAIELNADAAVNKVAFYYARNANTVEFLGHGGEGGMAGKTETGFFVHDRQLPQLPDADKPVRTGYVFEGWFATEAGEGACYYDADGSCAYEGEWVAEHPSAVIQLHARWTAEAYDISFQAGEGTGAGYTVAYTYEGEPATFGEPDSASITAPADSEFAGWQVATADGTVLGTYLATDAANRFAGVNGQTLIATALWVKSAFTITWSAAGGTFAGGEAQVSVKAAAGSAVADAMPAAEPTKAGALFDGWSLNGVAVSAEELAAMKVEGDLAFVAKWDQPSFLVTFKGGVAGAKYMGVYQGGLPSHADAAAAEEHKAEADYRFYNEELGCVQQWVQYGQTGQSLPVIVDLFKLDGAAPTSKAWKRAGATEVDPTWEGGMAVSGDAMFALLYGDGTPAVFAAEFQPTASMKVPANVVVSVNQTDTGFEVSSSAAAFESTSAGDVVVTGLLEDYGTDDPAAAQAQKRAYIDAAKELLGVDSLMNVALTVGNDDSAQAAWGFNLNSRLSNGLVGDEIVVSAGGTRAVKFGLTGLGADVHIENGRGKRDIAKLVYTVQVKQ